LTIYVGMPECEYQEERADIVMVIDTSTTTLTASEFAGFRDALEDSIPNLPIGYKLSVAHFGGHTLAKTLT
jgi:hypothetical protein